MDAQLAALAPLRERCLQLQAQARTLRERAAAQWAATERPALKEHARGLRDTLVSLAAEEAALRRKLEALATHSLASDPSVSTGFNVIRSRTDRAGQPLALEELQAERRRLIDALGGLNGQIAAAKAEITRQRRKEDAEVWETQLVALQDTKRVYRDEINLVEVELLGREHGERIRAERAAAEASGAAALQRLQDQALQTRIKFNRAKYRYYYPRVRGYNINFGGAGIYGACRNIDISEIHGYATVRAEVGAPATATTPVRPARIVIQFEAARTGSSGAAQQAPQGSQAPMQAAPSGAAGGGGAAAWGPPAEAQRAAAQAPATSMRVRSMTEPTQETPQDAAAVAARLQRTSTHPAMVNGTSVQQRQQQQQQQQQQGAGPPRPARPMDAASSRSLHASASHSSSSSASAATRPPPCHEHQAPSAAAAAPPRPPPSPYQQAAAAHLQRLPPPPPPPPPVQGKRANVAMRFLKSIGSKKEKYQSKERGQAQPQPAEEHEHEGGGKKKLRTLASKLLHRRGSRESGRDDGSRGSLERLEFGGSRLGGAATSRSSLVLNGSIDEEASVHFSDSNADEMDDLSEAAAGDEAGLEAPEGPATVVEEGDGSLASEDEYECEEEGSGADAGLLGNGPGSPLTQEVLAARQRAQDAAAPPPPSAHTAGSGGSGPGAWPHGPGSRSAAGGAGGAGAGSSRLDGSSVMDDASAGVVSLGDWMSADAAADAAPAGAVGKGVFVTGRVNMFELTGEKGTKCPSLSIGEADVRARVFCRFVFDYTSAAGWHKGDKALFDVQHLAYKLRGNNVPMPSALVKQLLRIFIPDIIHRRLQMLLPKELGDYLMTAQRGVDVGADVALVGPALAVLDADLAFEVRGPARSTKEAKKQQHKYAAAKEARSLLGLSLPQAQVLGELFNGRAALVDPPRPASIAALVAFQAAWDGYPQLYDQALHVLNTAYQVLAQGMRGAGDFHFRTFMEGPVARLRRKPARARVICRNLDVGLNADGLVSMVHAYTQRMLEELFIKGPQANPHDSPEVQQDAMEEQLEVLHAWHGFMLRELSHFKSKFRGAAATLLGAGDKQGFSLGMENAHYEGPLRMRLPVNMQLDADGAFSFEVPLPSPTGKIGVFMDVFKSLVVPSHLRPPAAAVNWAELSGDSEVTAAMQARLGGAVAAIQTVLDELNAKIEELGLEAEDGDAAKVLSQPRTCVGDRLGRLIVNRLKARVRLDERRIGEIMQGIDAGSMGPAFASTAGRLLGHLGDVMTLGFTPAAPPPGAPPEAPPSQYLFQFESSDISRLRVDVQSLGFVSAVTPGGLVRLAHALARAFLAAFKGASEAELEAVHERFQGWYSNMTREGLELSICVDAKAGLEGGAALLRLFGTADDAALRTTSPCVLTQDLDLRTLGRLMRGDHRTPQPAAGLADGLPQPCKGSRSPVTMDGELQELSELSEDGEAVLTVSSTGGDLEAEAAAGLLAGPLTPPRAALLALGAGGMALGYWATSRRARRLKRRVALPPCWLDGERSPPRCGGRGFSGGEMETFSLLSPLQAFPDKASARWRGQLPGRGARRISKHDLGEQMRAGRAERIGKGVAGQAWLVRSWALGKAEGGELLDCLDRHVVVKVFHTEGKDVAQVTRMMQRECNMHLKLAEECKARIVPKIYAYVDYITLGSLTLVINQAYKGRLPAGALELLEPEVAVESLRGYDVSTNNLVLNHAAELYSIDFGFSHDAKTTTALRVAALRHTGTPPFRSLLCAAGEGDPLGDLLGAGVAALMLEATLLGCSIDADLRRLLLALLGRLTLAGRDAYLPRVRGSERIFWLKGWTLLLWTFDDGKTGPGSGRLDHATVAELLTGLRPRTSPLKRSLRPLRMKPAGDAKGGELVDRLASLQRRLLELSRAPDGAFKDEVLEACAREYSLTYRDCWESSGRPFIASAETPSQRERLLGYHIGYHAYLADCASLSIEQLAAEQLKLQVRRREKSAADKSAALAGAATPAEQQGKSPTAGQQQSQAHAVKQLQAEEQAPLCPFNGQVAAPAGTPGDAALAGAGAGAQDERPRKRRRTSVAAPTD
eukprot:scaffold11.g3983.t1